MIDYDDFKADNSLTESHTFFELAIHPKGEDDQIEYLQSLVASDPGDREMIEVFFKNSQYRQVRLKAGKMLYY